MMSEMVAALDVDYEGDVAYAAAVVFGDWADSVALAEKVVAVAGADSYQPGQFFRRELPGLLAVLRQGPPVQIVLVDGYVWLDGKGKPGLGAHLYQALEGKVAVVGVAKTKFAGAEQALQIFREQSQRPLFITAAGMENEQAAERVKAMHGPYRLPTMLRHAHRLSKRKPETVSKQL